MVFSTFATFVRWSLLSSLLDSIWMTRLISNKIVVLHQWGSKTQNLNLNNWVDEVSYTTACSTDNQYIWKPAPKSLFWPPSVYQDLRVCHGRAAKKAIPRLIILANQVEGKFEHTSGNSLGSFSNEDIKKAIGLLHKTRTLHAHNAFTVLARLWCENA